MKRVILTNIHPISNTAPPFSLGNRMSVNVFRVAFKDALNALSAFIANDEHMQSLSKLADEISSAFDKRGKVLICGNGGSQCDALHFAEEFTGRYRKNRRALPVLALGEASHVTCVGNDYGFEEIFARGVQAFGEAGDILIVLSTSGNSGNIIKAVAEARRKGLKTAALLGKGGGKIKGTCDYEWVVPGETSDRIQEIHMCMLHILIEAIERKMFPENY